MNELENLLQHFSDLIDVKIVSNDKELIYKGKIGAYSQPVNEWLKKENCTIYDIVRWDMYINYLCIMVNLCE